MNAQLQQQVHPLYPHVYHQQQYLPASRVRNGGHLHSHSHPGVRNLKLAGPSYDFNGRPLNKRSTGSTMGGGRRITHPVGSPIGNGVSGGSHSRGGSFGTTHGGTAHVPMSVSMTPQSQYLQQDVEASMAMGLVSLDNTGMDIAANNEYLAKLKAMNHLLRTNGMTPPAGSRQKIFRP